MLRFSANTRVFYRTCYDLFMEIDYCGAVATPSTQDDDNLPDDALFDSNDAKYVAELKTFISSENAMNYRDEEIMPDSTTGYAILLSENSNNDDKIESSISFGEYCNNKNGTEGENIQEIDIKEEEEVDDVIMVSSQGHSNEAIEMTGDGSAENLMPRQRLHNETPIIDENNAEKNDIRNANNFINRQRRNEILNFLRMYCTECINVGINKGLPGPKRKCVKCNRMLRFKCLKCKERFKKYHTAYQHVKFRCIHETLLKCFKCNYTTLDERNLAYHTKQYHDNNQCSKCGEKFENYATLKKHRIHQCKFKTLKIKKKLDVYSNMEHFCEKCDKIISKGQRTFYKKCEDCFQYSCMRCTNCKLLCRNNMAAYTHLKFKCPAFALNCHHCNYKTSENSVLEKHLQDLHLPKKCKLCNIVLSGKISLKRHMLELHKKQKVTMNAVKNSWLETFCSKCDNILERNNQTTEKCFDCTSDKVLYQCKVCLKRYAYKSSIYSHYYTVHRTSDKRKKSACIKCSICENIIPLKGLRKHMKTTHTIINCKKCGVKCENYDFWMKHKAEQCSSKDDDFVKCSICDFLTTNKNLYKHIKYQHTAIDCQRCGTKLENSTKLEEHLRNECVFRDKATIRCPTCNTLLKRKNFNKHMYEVHTFDVYHNVTQSDGNSHNCTLCGCIFFTARELTKHIKYVHDTWTCSQCGMKCDDYYCMRRHQAYECSSNNNCKKTDNINVYCSECCESAKLIYALKVSKCSVCQGVLQYQCGTCRTNCKNYKNVKAHIRKVCSEKPSLSCPYCDHKEKTESLLEIHIKKCINSNQSIT
ncbi:zinc finger protein 729-like isoform X2 [Nasonia vitripennis]|uniref:C2H2-type domain-containing protein n=1 Tax=Nasonia vitripennis TaxID=7425 RepID=A0A7M7ISE2_NASVI|nr:zinc finger protein 729-like isoform X2 [Nasonia vitripennis]